MLNGIARVLLLTTLYASIGAFTSGGASLTTQKKQKTERQESRTTSAPEPTRPPVPQPTPPDDAQEIDTLKTTTNLVMVPVIATDAAGLYIPDLQQTELTVVEDGVKQEIAFFATVSAPFSVVLMLDTSASTQEKLSSIQRAAVVFVEQLQKADRVKVISFDDQVRDLNDFTTDRAVVKSAILKTQSGYGTKFYDAIDLALASIKQIQGRKAIVIFTDGVDYRSDDASFDGTLRFLDEEGVLVYPIRFNTRAATERLAREQAGQPVALATIDVIRKPSGTTAPTFPGEGPSSVPTSGTRPRTGPFGLPLPEEILRRRSESRRDRDRVPQTDRPPAGEIGVDLPTGRSDPRVSSKGSEKPPEDSIGMMLDRLYTTADSYLKALADKSGGRLLRADDIASLPEAFARIAGELRTQYSLGYYPLNRTSDDKYRTIKVTSTRKNVIIRARPGYRRK